VGRERERERESRAQHNRDYTIFLKSLIIDRSSTKSMKCTKSVYNCRRCSYFNIVRLVKSRRAYVTLVISRHIAT
jgi:hypothetical protein